MVAPIRIDEALRAHHPGVRTEQRLSGFGAGPHVIHEALGIFSEGVGSASFRAGAGEDTVSVPAPGGEGVGHHLVLCVWIDRRPFAGEA